MKFALRVRYVVVIAFAVLSATSPVSAQQEVSQETKVLAIGPQSEIRYAPLGLLRG